MRVENKMAGVLQHSIITYQGITRNL